jgi:PPOX class probable F420-dependent enzyme
MKKKRPNIQLSTEERDAFLSAPNKAALATVDKDGFPHVVAMTFRYKDGVIYMTSYGKAQKVLNARRNPKVGVMVEMGKEYFQYKGVLIRGRCEVIDDPQAVRETVRGVITSEIARTETAIPHGSAESAPKRVVLKITPEKISSWDHAKLGGKY